MNNDQKSCVVIIFLITFIAVTIFSTSDVKMAGGQFITALLFGTLGSLVEHKQFKKR